MTSAKVLLVDDEPAFLRLAGAWLEAQGYAVVRASGAAEALTVFAAERPDLVVLDLVMPPERTAQAGLALVPEFAAVPVIVLTAHADHEHALAAVAAGAWDFLAKPIEPELLQFSVERALQKASLEREVERLRRETASDGMVGASPAMQRLRELIARIGPTEAPVMVLGPTGTGKELVARALHAASVRARKPFVAVHCGAIPADLFESELFGHLKGAFTGAHQDRPGLIAAAQGGTLFLDEVGETPPAMQVKLLRFLQEGEYMAVGGRSPQKADVRIVSATHRDLDGMVASGAMREDFFYRLKGVVLRTPALAERREDIAQLAAHFLVRAAGGAKKRMSTDALAWLSRQDWPGNVRELKSVVACAAALASDGARISPDDFAFARSGATAKPDRAGAAKLAEAVADLERRMISAALAETGDNQSAAARRLGLSRVGLIKMMRRLEIG
jgi:two-component system NtrC family response regulator